MSTKWFLVRALAVMLAVFLLIASLVAAYYVGWTGGYATGQVVAAGEEEAGVALPPRGPGYPVPPLGLVHPLLLVGLILLLLLMAGKVLRWLAWERMWASGRFPMSGPWAGHWARHWHYGRMPHGPMPPWGWPSGEGAEGTAAPSGETGG